MYVPQLIYYGVSPPRKNASVFYGDKSSLKHFASIDLSANNRTTARNRFHVWMIPASFFLFSFLLFFLTVKKNDPKSPRIENFFFAIDFYDNGGSKEKRKENRRLGELGAWF